MDRKEIKSLAKEKIKGNIWNILWPLLIIMVISSILTDLVGGGSLYTIDVDKLRNLSTIDYESLMSITTYNPTAQAWSLVVEIIMGIASAGYLKYLLNFVRDGSAEFNDIIEVVKKKWLQILLAEILVSVIVGLFSLLFIIPGIIMGFAYAMVTYLIIDTDIEAKDALKKSKEMMKGYKWDYFVFNLSFIGWYLLVPFTLGIILIWLVPYVRVAQALYYDNLKEVNG